MRIIYECKDISKRNRANCVGDLLRYYGETRYKIVESLEKIKNNKTISAMLVNSMRKRAGMTGLTVDMLLTRLENTAQMKMLDLKINGKQPYIIFEDGEDMEIEIFMDDLYFETKAMLDQALPGIRKKPSVDVYVFKEKEAWVRWFEKNLKDYHPLDKCFKRVVEQ
jgi:hypothetical protein